MVGRGDWAVESNKRQDGVRKRGEKEGGEGAQLKRKKKGKKSRG